MIKLRHILTEGKYDKLVLDLSRDLINQFKQNKSYTVEFEIVRKNEEYAEVELTVKFKKNKNLKYAFSIDAGADFDEMDISVEYNPSFFPMAMSDLVAEIKETIRHEVEHIGQQNFEGKEITDKRTGKDFVGYLLQANEVPAYVQGLYKRAKTKRISVPQAMEQWYNENKANFNNPKEWDKVKQIWTTWGKKNLPNANWSE